jgi:hypothetical protein
MGEVDISFESCGDRVKQGDEEIRVQGREKQGHHPGKG